MESMKLWENGTPYFNPEYGQEETTITPYLVKEGNKEKGLVIVCPGGGYSGRAPHEGEPIAKMLNAAGISAAVLNYRVAPYKHPVMITDANRAVKFVRYHAAEWEIDPEKIGILGFSAGGHFAVAACEHYDYGKDDGDEIDKMSSRPNAGIFCYPVATFIDEYTHHGTLHNLLGQNPDPELRSKLSGEQSVPDDCPPIFMWHTSEDSAVNVNNSLEMGRALRAKNIPFELHVFPYGFHGLGLANEEPRLNPHVSQWASLLVNWLKLYNF